MGMMHLLYSKTQTIKKAGCKVHLIRGHELHFLERFSCNATFLSCQSVESNYNADSEGLVAKQYGVGELMSDVKALGETLIKAPSSTPSHMSRKNPCTNEERINRYFSTLSTEQKRELNRRFGNALICLQDRFTRQNIGCVFRFNN